MMSFGKCHILKPENSSPKRNLNPHYSIGGRLGSRRANHYTMRHPGSVSFHNLRALEPKSMSVRKRKKNESMKPGSSPTPGSQELMYVCLCVCVSVCVHVFVCVHVCVCVCVVYAIAYMSAYTLILVSPGCCVDTFIFFFMIPL